MAKDNAKKITSLVVLIILLVVAWFVAPLFLPVYKWLHVDLAKEAKRAGVPLESLSQEYDIVLRYNPRGNDHRDPAPWEILEMNPEWYTGNTEEWEREDEYQAAVRCIIMSDRTGLPPKQLFIGGLEKDRYFRCKGIRFKPGALGNDSPRPVVLYDGMSWEKLDATATFHYMTGIKFDNVDDFTDRYWDDFDPEELRLQDQEAAEAAAEAEDNAE